ncbi:single-stranded DNA-binding protein [Jiangella endophytica]|uniref:single-stranded DNA-binding protein n=1 Tax=Jiangella endophytica TaxID=1623398 RepID=UPI0013007BB3|nr:single-stranded DNA-binding protein [Jiangella endophytica]
MSEVMITVVGNVATEPRLDATKKGETFASFRLACNGQRYDTRARSWVDDDTSFYTVYCWRSPLADNIKASLRKGDPVVVHGRLRNREWRDDNHVMRVSPEITARSLGHDLYRGTSSFTKVSRQPILPEDDDAVDSVRAAYFTDDQHGTVDQRTGEIMSGSRPALEASPAAGGTTVDQILSRAPAAVGDRLTAGDRMAAGDRLMGDDRSAGNRSPAVSGGSGGGADGGDRSAASPTAAPAKTRQAADTPADTSPTPRAGGRTRREKAGVGA